MRITIAIAFFAICSCSGSENIKKISYDLALKSDTLIERGELRNALSTVEEAIDIDKNNCIAYNNLGFIKQKLRYPENEVLYAFSKSYELNNNYLIGLYSLTNYYLELKEYNKVLNFGNQYLNKTSGIEEINKQRSHILSIMGESYNYLNDYQEAIIYLSESLKINPSIAASYKERGIAHRNIKNNKEALKDFNTAIILDSLYHQAYNSRAIYYDNLDMNDEAMRDYDKALSIEPNSLTYLLNRAKLYIKMEDIEKACIDIRLSDSLGNKEAHQYLLKYCIK